MLMILLLVLALVAFAAAVVRQGTPGAPPVPRHPALPELGDTESPSELSLRDPVDALRRYGTPADAARLAEQGTDLSALGYRPPRD
jgi:hypothetical protein